MTNTCARPNTRPWSFEDGRVSTAESASGLLSLARAVDKGFSSALTGAKVAVRVALIAPDIDLSALTGDTWHVKDLTVALARTETDVDLVVGRASDWSPSGRVLIYELRTVNTLRATLQLRKILASGRPDVLYERRESPKLSAILGKLIARPYFVEINGIADEEKAMQGRLDAAPRWLRKRKEAIRGLLLRNARGIVTVTAGLRDEVASRYGVPRDQFAVIPNGVDLNLFRPMAKTEARRRLGLGEPGPYLVFVGNMVAWQGVQTILQGLDQIRREQPEVNVLLVGDGIERKRLEQLAIELGVASHVQFVGRQPRESVPAWISAADIALMPSTRRRNERIGTSALKLREYLACGRPVVATNLEGGGPFLEKHGVGKGTRTDDPVDLASVVLSLLRDPSALEAMGLQARALAERDLSWDLVAERVLAFLTNAKNDRE